MKIECIAIALVLFAITQNARAAEPLSKAKIEALVAMPDTGDPMPEALSFYPRALEYTASATIRSAEGQAQQMPEATVREKLVAGGYLVSSIRFPGAPADMHMVVYYDKANDVYRKSIVPPVGDEVVHSVGTHVEGSDSISWIMHHTTPDGKTNIVLSQEKHGENESTWREVYILDGEIKQIVIGKAVVTKRPAAE